MDVSFSQALEGYTLAAHARRLSHRTIEDYFGTFRKFERFLGADLAVGVITADHVRRFLAAQGHLSRKTVLNYHTGLSALWRWMVGERLVESNVVREVRPPKPERRAIAPYSERDVRAMLSAMEFARPYKRPGKRVSTHKLGSVERTRAIIMVLLDTGIRAEELCGLTVGDTDLKNRRIKVFGKGAKERILPLSPRTSQAVWRYLTTRPKAEKTRGMPLLLKESGLPFDRRSLYKLIRRVGLRAGVDGAGVHRFRHTYAINYLRNGGNPYALQLSLGHSTMEMTQRYLALADADIEAVHQQASPVTNWRL